MVAEIINCSLNWPDFGVGGVKISKKKIKVLELSEKARNAIKIICCRCVFSIGRGNYICWGWAGLLSYVELGSLGGEKRSVYEGSGLGERETVGQEGEGDQEDTSYSSSSLSLYALVGSKAPIQQVSLAGLVALEEF